MALLPGFIDTLELAADDRPRELPIAAHDELDEDRVVADRRIASIEQHVDELGMLVGETGERVEEHLEGDVLGGVNDRSHEGNVPARKGYGVANPVTLLFGPRAQGDDVGVGATRGRQPHGLRRHDATHLEKRDDKLAPRRILGTQAADPRRKHVEAGALPPVGHHCPRPMTGGDESQRFKPRQRGPQGQPVHPQRESQLPLGRHPRPGSEASREDLTAKTVRNGVHDSRTCDGYEVGQGVAGR